MPIYCYESKSGDLVEKTYDMGKAPESIKVKGRKYTRSFVAESVGVPATAGWPLECLGSGVNADQRKELGDFLAKKGVPTEISKDGNPVYRDAVHRRKALKARNLIDKASYI